MDGDVGCMDEFLSVCCLSVCNLFKLLCGKFYTHLTDGIISKRPDIIHKRSLPVAVRGISHIQAYLFGIRPTLKPAIKIVGRPKVILIF